MESSNMKNMMVLKKLPSNMIEEAIIVFKQTNLVKQKELIDKYGCLESNELETKSKEYIVKEAEMLVEDYIHKTEKKDNTLKNKYSKLKKYSIISTVILIISLILNFI